MFFNVIETTQQIEGAMSEIDIATKAVIHDTITSIIGFIPKFIFLVIILFVGLKVIKIASKILAKFMRRREVDDSVIKFVVLMVEIVFKLILIISIIKYLGIETTSFVAMIGASALAIGMALQGSLQNFAGGVIILILKPFKTGDDVEFSGQRGVVKEVQLFSTIIEKFATNENVIIPNSAISSSIITNWSKERDRRVDVMFSVAYGENLEIVKSLVKDKINSDSRIINTSNTVIFVNALADSSVNLELRTWVHPDDYLQARSDFLESIYNTLNEHNIEIPFPNITVHSKN